MSTDTQQVIVINIIKEHFKFKLGNTYRWACWSQSPFIDFRTGAGMRKLWAGLLIPLRRKRNSITINKMVYTNGFMDSKKTL